VIAVVVVAGGVGVGYVAFIIDIVAVSIDVVCVVMYDIDVVVVVGVVVS